MSVGISEETGANVRNKKNESVPQTLTYQNQNFRKLWKGELSHFPGPRPSCLPAISGLTINKIGELLEFSLMFDKLELVRFMSTKMPSVLMMTVRGQSGSQIG